jgi:cytoskeletal protein RodZ
LSTYRIFGQFLRAQRELKRLSVAFVAQATKISPTLIEALEEGQSERFPERIFLLNYVRSYAESVGLPPAEVLAKFEALALPVEAPLQLPESGRLQPVWKAGRLLVWLFAAASLLAFWYAAALAAKFAMR